MSEGTRTVFLEPSLSDSTAMGMEVTAVAPTISWVLWPAGAQVGRQVPPDAHEGPVRPEKREPDPPDGFQARYVGQRLPERHLAGPLYPVARGRRFPVGKPPDPGQQHRRRAVEEQHV